MTQKHKEVSDCTEIECQYDARENINLENSTTFKLISYDDKESLAENVLNYGNLFGHYEFYILHKYSDERDSLFVIFPDVVLNDNCVIRTNFFSVLNDLIKSYGVSFFDDGLFVVYNFDSKDDISTLTGRLHTLHKLSRSDCSDNGLVVEG